MIVPGRRGSNRRASSANTLRNVFKNGPKSSEKLLNDVKDRAKLWFDEFQLDVAKRRLLRAGEVVPIYSKAFDLLLFLVQSGGRDVGKDEILDPFSHPESRTQTSVTISAVRRALGEGLQPRYLITIGPRLSLRGRCAGTRGRRIPGVNRA